MYMQVLRRSRKKPRAGDVFAYKFADRGYGFGRVICASTAAWPEIHTVLIYLYTGLFRDMSEIPNFDPPHLLYAPLITDLNAWRLGYFQTISHAPLSGTQVLPVHCFSWRTSEGVEYRDEFGRILPYKTEPCGSFGIDMAGMIDIRIAESLGMPPHPDTIPREEDFAPEPSCVTVAIPLGADDFETADLSRLLELEDLLEARMMLAELGLLEGHEIGGGYFRSFFTGPDRRALQKQLADALRALGAPLGSYVERTHGGRVDRISF